ncbi:MAG: AMP-binding protein [Acidimicrobiia bacterium]|nr:AMP-binding protein [Acidimicrobiia bacterium]
MLERPLDSWIATWAEHRPHAPALSFGEGVCSYGELAGRIDGWAAWLASAAGGRVGHGDRVAYLAQNRPEQVELLFACARLGAMLVPLNWRLTPAEHAFQLGDADPAVVLAERSYADHVTATRWGGPVVDLAVAASAVERRGAAAVEARGRATDGVLLVYTSGTTGRPKGAVLDQNALAATALNGVFAQDLTSGDRVLTTIPLFHVGGLCIQTLPALYVGAAVRIQPGFDPDSFFDDVASWRPTLGLLVPAILAGLAVHPRWADADLSSLRGVMTGSSVVPAAVLAPWHERGVPCGQIYGCTETGPTALALRLDDAVARAGSCGRAVPWCEVRLVDGDGRDVAAGERGELVVRGPNVLRAYWRNEAATADAFVAPIDGGAGWFRTGDIGHRDDEGWWYIDDRSKDVVISGGENVYPAELEAVLADRAAELGIAEAAVVGRPDERWGEVPVAVVAPLEGTTVPVERVLAAFEGRLARYKHPKDVVVVERLPRNAMGKVQKFLLRDLLTPPTRLEDRPPAG